MFPHVRWLGPAQLFLLGFLLWLLNHPYMGVWHDARIYGLLAAHWIDPAGLAGDLFFRYGSQGELSAFTPIFGELVRAMGLDWAARMVVLSGAAIWCVASLLAAGSLLGPGAAARFAVLLLAVVTVSYSPNGDVFSLGENFATARSWATPLGFASVALLVSGRPIGALGLGLVATALHPLLGIWSVAAWVLVRVGIRFALLFCTLPVFLLVLLGAMNPDAAGLRLMSGDWLNFALYSAPDVLLHSFSEGNLADYFGVLVALALGARLGSATARPFYLRLALLGGSGLSLTLLASFVYPVEIFVQGQPWRVFALLLPFALLAVLDGLQAVARNLMFGAWPILLFGALLALGRGVWLPLLFLVTVASLLPLVHRAHVHAWMAAHRRWWQWGIVVLWLLLLPGLYGDLELLGGKMLRPWWEGLAWLHGLVAGGGWFGPAMLALAPILLRKPTMGITVGISLVLLAALVLVLSAWDRRTERALIDEACQLDRRCSPHPFRALMAPGQTVFWPGKELEAWLLLQRPSYYGRLQGTGAVFSRARFEEWVRREIRVKADASPLALCADIGLDWLVLPQASLPLAPRAVWLGSGLYACADIRRMVIR